MNLSALAIFCWNEIEDAYVMMCIDSKVNLNPTLRQVELICQHGLMCSLDLTGGKGQNGAVFGRQIAAPFLCTDSNAHLVN